jgi:hypothetical protein
VARERAHCRALSKRTSPVSTAPLPGLQLQAIEARQGSLFRSLPRALHKGETRQPVNALGLRRACATPARSYDVCEYPLLLSLEIKMGKGWASLVPALSRIWMTDTFRLTDGVIE